MRFVHAEIERSRALLSLRCFGQAVVAHVCVCCVLGIVAVALMVVRSVAGACRPLACALSVLCPQCSDLNAAHWEGAYGEERSCFDPTVCPGSPASCPSSSPWPWGSFFAASSRRATAPRGPPLPSHLLARCLSAS